MSPHAPPKTVHFASADIVIPPSPAPSLPPSPTLSPYSPAFSSPATPEDASLQLDPVTPNGCLAQLPDVSGDAPSAMLPTESRLCIHASLAFGSHTPAAIRYDLAHPPSALVGAHPYLEESATKPPREHLLVAVLWPGAGQWDIPIYATAAYVTCLDVLSTLHRELWLPITHAEYQELNSDVQRQVDSSFWARCSRIMDPIARVAEERRGVKRIDFLMGRTSFRGLSARQGGSWRLHVSF
ncbi:hypothetical protein HDZ31DRAFT_33633 [Schizophyllum fasciatum]